MAARSEIETSLDHTFPAITFLFLTLFIFSIFSLNQRFNFWIRSNKDIWGALLKFLRKHSLSESEGRKIFLILAGPFLITESVAQNQI